MAVICRFAGNGRQVKGGGWLYRLADGQNGGHAVTHARPGPSQRAIDWVSLDKTYRKAMPARKIAAVAELLGVSSASLASLGIGTCGNSTLTFPMFMPYKGGGCEIVGIRTRDAHGKKAIEGSRNGWFLPAGWSTQSDCLFIAEGPTDTAAVLTAGFPAIGRSHCAHEEGAELLLFGRRACVLGDNDGGKGGAERLAKRIKSRVLYPPSGIKDIREWLHVDRGGLVQALTGEANR